MIFGIIFAKLNMCFSVPSGIWLFCFSAKRFFASIRLPIGVKDRFGGGAECPDPPGPPDGHPPGRFWGDSGASPQFTSWRENEANAAKAKTKVNSHTPTGRLFSPKFNALNSVSNHVEIIPGLKGFDPQNMVQFGGKRKKGFPKDIFSLRALAWKA